MKSFLHDPVSRLLTTDGVIQHFTDAIGRAETTAQSIRELRDADDAMLTWDATFGAFDRMTQDIQEAICIPQLISVTHENADVRNAAKGAEPLVDAFVSKLYLDDAIANVLERASTLSLLTKGGIGGRCRARLIEHTLRDYRRNGLSLPESDRVRLRELNEKLTAMGQEFDTNLAETTLHLDIRAEQLDGLPESFIANHPAQADGSIRLTTDYPDLIPFLRYAKDRGAARELYRLSECRAAEKNIPLLKKIVALRHEKAALLGFSTWADYVLEPRMAKTAVAVKTFLTTLHEGLIDPRKREVDELVAMQRLILPEAGEVISVSDVKYLEDAVSKRRFNLDTQKLSEYFEGGAVLQGIIDIASKVYGISFHRIQTPTWHPDVLVFDVLRDGSAFSRVYLDLHPREGKFKHAAVFGMVETCVMESPSPDQGDRRAVASEESVGRGEVSRRMPIAALVCNFPKPGASPALMSHDDVVTFFHEFGHLLHHVLSESELATFAGTNVARDFVEVPSQLFEQWAWERETLDMFAKQYLTGERLPDELFNAMTAARKFGVAIATERQLFLATYDYVFHTRAPGFDPEALVLELYPQFSSFIRVPETHFPCTFGHLIGYDAAYYSYQWALALAYDVMSRFHAEGFMNTQTATDYRECILSKGGSEDEMSLVESFLGRPSSTDAYLKYLGIRE
jgi:thimet oligopeptidase